MFLPAVASALGGSVCASPYDCTSDNASTVTCTTALPDGCWRLPEIDELLTIVDLSAPGCDIHPSTTPCIDPIFGPTAPSFYWSATSGGSPFVAWSVFFVSNFVGQAGKDFVLHARAVRSRP